MVKKLDFVSYAGCRRSIAATRIRSKRTVLIKTDGFFHVVKFLCGSDILGRNNNLGKLGVFLDNLNGYVTIFRSSGYISVNVTCKFSDSIINSSLNVANLNAALTYGKNVSSFCTTYTNLLAGFVNLNLDYVIVNYETVFELTLFKEVINVNSNKLVGFIGHLINPAKSCITRTRNNGRVGGAGKCIVNVAKIDPVK